MLNIKSVLDKILAEVECNSPNIKVENDQHFIDKISGVEFHLYDDYFQMTRGEEEQPISQSAFTEEEKMVVMAIKNLITDPAVTQDKKTHYKKYLMESRQDFADWFENPVPEVDQIVEEVGTTAYIR
jgi:hypothetical protein